MLHSTNKKHTYIDDDVLKMMISQYHFPYSSFFYIIIIISSSKIKRRE